MKKRVNFDSEPWRVFYLVLLSLAGLLVAVLAIGTIYGFARSGEQPLFTLGKQAETVQPVPVQWPPNGDIRVFSDMGRLRIPLSNSSIMILSIAFPYNASDIAFTEELAGKIVEFRDTAIGYFSSLPADRLININEETAKTEILALYNANLRLGRIEALYFSDMNIIDGNP